jgi:hypothetical protein
MREATKRIIEAVVIAAATALATWGVDELRATINESRQEKPKKAKKAKR